MTKRVIFPRRELDRAPIALVDTSLEMRSIIRGVLNAIGAHRVIAVQNIARFKELQSEDVALLVMHMDSVGLGSALCRAVRRQQTPIQQGIPIVGYAQNPTIETVRTSLMSGLDEFLSAPCTTQAMKARIDAVLDRPKPLIVNQAYIGPDHSKFLRSLGEFMNRANSVAER